MTKLWTETRIGEVLHRVERFESRDDSMQYQFAGTYSFGRGIFVSGYKDGVSFKLDLIQRVSAGDFVYCKIMAWEGAFGIVPPKADNCVLSGAFCVYEIDRSVVDPVFLNYYFKLESVWKRVGMMSQGTNVRRRSLHPSQFEEAILPLPPLEEQRRVVARIETLAAKIEDVRLLRQAVEVETNNFIVSLHDRLAGNRELHLGEALMLAEDQVEVEAGVSYPQTGIKAYGRGLFPTADVDGASTAYRSFNRLYEGAVVLSQVKGWEGAIAVCGPDIAGRFASPEYRTFRCIPGMAVPYYLSEIFATPWFHSKLAGLTRGIGARRERIRPERFLNLKMTLPATECQENAARIFQKLRYARAEQGAMFEEVDALMPAVLDRAFKGEL